MPTPVCSTPTPSGAAAPSWWCSTGVARKSSEPTPETRRLQHAPAWGAFNKAAASTGDVGIFHETYVVPSERVESLYGNIAPFGLAKAHGAVSRSERRVHNQAHRRLSTTEPEYAIEP